MGTALSTKKVNKPWERSRSHSDFVFSTVTIFNALGFVVEITFWVILSDQRKNLLHFSKDLNHNLDNWLPFRRSVF